MSICFRGSRPILTRNLSLYAFQGYRSLFDGLQVNRELEACYNSDGRDLATFKPAIRLQHVVGLRGRFNDLLYSPPLTEESCTLQMTNPINGIVVFFGGDMQDFHENMVSKEETKKFANWSLENTAQLLSMHYKNCHIVIVRPSSIEDGIFSNYSNFVPSSKYGQPNFTPNHGSVLHLNRLIANLQESLTNLDLEEIKHRVEVTSKILENKHSFVPSEDDYRKDLNRCCIELVGFSKGCVVLNQFLHEFNHFNKVDVERDKQAVDLIDRIKKMRWMDGGHSGKEGTWVTSEEILDNYAVMGKQTFVHVTPYQVLCPKRPWIGKEEKIFTEYLTKKNVEIERKLHLENSKGTLEDHFNLLREVFSNRLPIN